MYEAQDVELVNKAGHFLKQPKFMGRTAYLETFTHYRSLMATLSPHSLPARFLSPLQNGGNKSVGY